VKKARALKGWTLDQLSHSALKRDNAKGFLSQIEKGKRQITARTAGQIINALELPDSLLDPFIGEAEVADDEVTLDDTKAQRLMEMAQKDAVTQSTSEALLISLAYEFAHGNHSDLFSAIKGLRAALEEAAALKARGNLPQNVGDQLQAVMQRVSALNDQGDRDGAQAEITAAMKRNEAERSALRNVALTQARISNDPDTAAALIVQQLREEARPQGLPKGVLDTQVEWQKKGFALGLRFEKEVALRLARWGYDRGKGPDKFVALIRLGTCLAELGEQDAGLKRLQTAEKAFRKALTFFQKTGHKIGQADCQQLIGNTLRLCFDRDHNRDHLLAAQNAFERSLSLQTKAENPSIWATGQSGLGGVLSDLGELDQKPELLLDAITAHNTAIEIYEADDDPARWARSISNRGLCNLRLARLTQNPADLDAAHEDVRTSLSANSRQSHLFHWAFDQWNLADLHLARHEISPDMAHLDTAQSHLDQAREVFAEGLSYHQLERCDELQGRIDAARGGGVGEPVG